MVDRFVQNWGVRDSHRVPRGRRVHWPTPGASEGTCASAEDRRRQNGQLMKSTPARAIVNPFPVDVEVQVMPSRFEVHFIPCASIDSP